MNVEIMRAFVRLRGLIEHNRDLAGPFDGDSALLGWAHWTAAALSACG